MKRMNSPSARLAALLFSSALALFGCSRSEGEAGHVRQDQKETGPLPRLGAVPELALIGADGAPASPTQLRGNPWILAFFFTRCPSVCPRVVARMKEVEATARKEGKTLGVVGITVDPENDTPEVLAGYAAKNELGDAWSLWTGDHATIVEAAEQGFKIGVSGAADPSKEHFGISHGSHLVLVDAQGEIRGYYRSFDEDVTPRLLGDLERL